MRIVCHLLLCLLALAQQVQAQKRNWNWLFRYNHVSFATGSPVNAGSSPIGQVAASISDTAGFLKAYLVVGGPWSGRLFNADHDLVAGQPVPLSLVSAASGRGLALFLPRPGFPNECYLALISSHASPGNPTVHTASLLWMDLGPPGSLAVEAAGQYEAFMDDPASCMMAIPHANGMDYWLVLQHGATSAFHAYRITEAGIDPAPVISDAGFERPPGVRNGVLAPTVQGDRFVSTIRGGAPAENDTLEAQLFSFDAATGAIAHLADLPSRRAEGVEFSPSGRYLYIDEELPFLQGGGATRTLVCYDTQSADIGATRVVVHSYDQAPGWDNTHPHALSLGPDGRIYRAREVQSAQLGVIQAPDLGPSLCAYEHVGHACAQTTTTLPAPMKRYHDDAWLPLSAAPGNPPGALRIFPNPAQERVRVHGATAGAARALVRDALGRVVLGNRMAHGCIEIGSLASGSYVVEVLDARGARVGAGRLVKE